MRDLVSPGIGVRPRAAKIARLRAADESSLWISQGCFQAADAVLDARDFELRVSARLRQGDGTAVVVQCDLRLAQMFQPDGEIEGVVRIVGGEVVRLEVGALRGRPLTPLGIQVAEREVQKSR